MKSYQLGALDTDTIIPKCYLKYEDRKLKVLKEVNLSSEVLLFTCSEI